MEKKLKLVLVRTLLFFTVIYCAYLFLEEDKIFEIMAVGVVAFLSYPLLIKLESKL